MRKYGILICLAMFAGCAYLEPLVQDINIISVPQEKEIGAQIELELAKEMKVLDGSALNQQVNAIGQRLVASLPHRDFDYRFHVIEDNTPNAFTIPGGVIYVHTGLIQFVSDDNELAGVLGHELGHAYERHPAKGLSRAYGVEYLAKLVFKGDTEGTFKTLALGLAKGGILSKYSRQDEYEADEAGYFLLKKAGYDTRGLVRFLKKIMNLERGGSSLPFLSSHPPTPDRIARLESFQTRASTDALQIAT